MIISCPNCSTRFTIPDAAIPATGRTVRCSKCGTKWRHPDETPLETAAETAAAPEPAPEPEAAPAEAVEEQADAAETPTPPWTAEPEAGADETAEETAEPEDAAGPALPDIDVSTDDKDEAPVEPGSAPDITAKRDEEAPVRPAIKREPIEEQKTSTGLIVGWAVLGVLVVAVIGGVIFFRQSIVDGWPAAGRLYNALGLSIEKPAVSSAEAPKPAPQAKVKPQFQTKSVTTSTETIDGTDYRVVNGTVVNSGTVAAAVPEVRTRLSGDDHKVLSETVHKLPERVLQPGETMTFSIKIASPPADARYLEVDTVSTQQ
ncbi:MAG TPA: zinc-ribbon domain-containing protein [Alphaproteobacteria bacterium]|nr:zinc-ribbon domain-containing protein [Alphaproteobacteria bacterium]